MTYTVLPEPLVLLDGGGWARPNPYELLDYWSLLDAHTGSNLLTSNEWLLFYMDIQPNEFFDKRYLVSRPVNVSLSRQPDEPRSEYCLDIGTTRNCTSTGQRSQPCPETTPSTNWKASRDT